MAAEKGSFVHLNVHTGYSLFGSTIRIYDLVERIRELGMKAVAITDDGVMFGAMYFYRSMVAAGVKPIIGCDCYLAPPTLADKSPAGCHDVTRLTLLAENREGYVNLCRLATIAAVSGLYQQPRIDRETLRKFSRGLICLSGGMQGDIAGLLQQGDFRAARAVARHYQQIFGEDNFFLEIQSTGLAGQAAVNQALREMSLDLSIPMAGTNGCRYLEPGDSRFLEMLLCRNAGKTFDDPDRPRAASDQLYVKSAGEMIALLADFKGAAENTLLIADRCNVEFDFTAYRPPRTRLEEETGRNADDVLREKSGQGLQTRLKVLRDQKGPVDEDIYRTRLANELASIEQAGMARYFLLMSELVDFAVAGNIPVGPGRGATPGSLVCYCLGITAIDSVAHGLLFERFFNSQRPTTTTIFLDVCTKGREKVIRHLLDTYNADDVLRHRAAHIISFGAMRLRACVREVARVLNVPKDTAEKMIRLIPSWTRELDDALAHVPALEQQIDACSSHGETLKQAVRRLTGLPRHPAIHRTGMVLSDEPLTGRVPLAVIRGKISTQYNACQAESLGLTLLEIRGLRHLTIINETRALIQEQGKTPLDMSRLDLADEQTFQLLGRGDTEGVFQLASAGMKKMLIQMKPDCFSDLVALIAMNRPGLIAMNCLESGEYGLIDDFIARKHGRRKIVCSVPELEPILKETYGLPLYQEQIMLWPVFLRSSRTVSAEPWGKRERKSWRSFDDCLSMG